MNVLNIFSWTATFFIADVTIAHFILKSVFVRTRVST